MRFCFLKKRHIKNECHFSRRIKTAWQIINRISNIQGPSPQQAAKLPGEQFRLADGGFFPQLEEDSQYHHIHSSWCCCMVWGQLDLMHLQAKLSVTHLLLGSVPSQMKGKGHSAQYIVVINWCHHQLTPSWSQHQLLAFMITEPLRVKDCWGEMC